MIVLTCPSWTEIATLVTALASFCTFIYLLIERRARLIPNIESIDGFYCLSIENVGERVAKHIKILIDDKFTDSLPDCGEYKGGKIKKILSDLSTKSLYIAPGKKKYFLLIQFNKKMPYSEYDTKCNDWHNKNSNETFLITIKYNRFFYKNFKFRTSDYCIGAFAVKNEFGKIAECLNKILKQVEKLND